jgi:predicted transcriptional regulator
MVNTEDFIKRLEIILDYYNLNASSFADKIGVQRSSLSHLLSGRNKPSLDFILKISAIFPDVDLYWILNGRGSFPKISELESAEKPLESISKQNNPTSSNPEDLLSKIKNANLTTKSEETTSDEIEKIVLFYKNGTFKIYNPN